MATKELLVLMNKAISDEIHASIQYAVQSFVWSGVHGFAVQGELMKIAKEEMSHIESISERIWYLGEMPTTQPSTIVVGVGLKDMIEQDIKDEESAIALYKQIIAQSTLEQDTTTAFLFTQILQAEEQHHDFYTTLNESL